MPTDTVVVFTAKGAEGLIAEGGTSSWRLDRNHARQCSYAVCTRNAHADWTEGNEPHGTAFLIGKVKDVVTCPRHPDRFLIQFSEYARLNVPEMWNGGRNPASYRSLEDLGIDPTALRWEPMPLTAENVAVSAPLPNAPSDAVRPLTLAEAKSGLAQTFGVSPEAIEITIRA
jgi:hypothetical protein